MCTVNIRIVINSREPEDMIHHLKFLVSSCGAYWIKEMDTELIVQCPTDRITTLDRELFSSGVNFTYMGTRGLDILPLQ